MIGQFFKS